MLGEVEVKAGRLRRYDIYYSYLHRWMARNESMPGLFTHVALQMAQMAPQDMGKCLYDCLR
jgi:hypothetical protein